MQFFRRSLICFSLFIFYVIIYSCQDEISYHYFIIEVDQIIAPDTIVMNETFDICLSGLIGVNGCYQFSEFKTTEKENELLIEAWGKINKNSSICSDEMVYLDNEILNYQIKVQGTFTIKAKQPTGSYIQKQIFAE